MGNIYWEFGNQREKKTIRNLQYSQSSWHVINIFQQPALDLCPKLPGPSQLNVCSLSKILLWL